MVGRGSSRSGQKKHNSPISKVATKRRISKRSKLDAPVISVKDAVVENPGSQSADSTPSPVVKTYTNSIFGGIRGFLSSILHIGRATA
jgi:hypothetical protein